MPLEADAAEVGQHHDRQRREADDGPRERAEEEAEGDEAERDAGECREQRRARVSRRTRSATNAHASSITPDDERREEPRLPRDPRRIGAPAAVASVFAGSMTRKTCAKSDTVLIP